MIRVLFILFLLCGCSKGPTITSFGPVDLVPQDVKRQVRYLNLPESAHEIYFFDEHYSNEMGPDPFTSLLRFSCEKEDVEKWANENFELSDKTLISKKGEIELNVSGFKWFDYQNIESGYYWSTGVSGAIIVFDDKRNFVYLLHGN